MSARLLVISHTYTIAHNRTKLALQREVLRERGGDFHAIVPAVVHEPWGVIEAEVDPEERRYISAIRAWPRSRNSLRLLAAGWTRVLDDFRPTHVHVEEEPFSLISLQVARAARARGARFSFFSWENLERSLPPPLPAVEALVSLAADRALAGNSGAARRLARRMPEDRIAIVPQLGIDVPRECREQGSGDPLRVIYVGRLVEEKGVLDLAAAASRARNIEVTFLGTGPLAGRLTEYASRGAAIRVLEKVPHSRVRDHLLEHDVLVLPSRPHPRWEEQFGHVLIEAMAVGLVTVGSDSGAIPEVIGQPDLIFRHGDVEQLAKLLQGLAADARRRRQLGAHFRALAQQRFTHERVALETLERIHALQPSAKRRVLLVADSPSEQWTSMDLYAREVSANLEESFDIGEMALLQAPGPPSSNPILRSLRVLVDRYLLLPLAVRRARPDVVHILDQTYAHLIRHAQPARVAITCHDLTPLEMPRFSIGWLLYRRAVAAIGTADRVVAISEATRDRLINRLGIASDRVTVAPYGLDPIFFNVRWKGPAEAIRILHVGSNADYKRMWIVTETAARLAATGRKVEFWKVGDSLGSRTNELLGSSGVHVRDFGRVPNQEIPGIYADATLLLFPSAYEGFGRPVAEAMAVGLPVVASAIDTLIEVTGGNAIHLPSSDPRAFADEIARLVGEPERMKALGDAAREWALRYRWEPHAATLQRVYTELEGAASR